ncbi:hypothetical protein RB195_011991 [Necator americanus]|uniref:Uncharacterized protein n=1 Tax=Necator americanus TaxID=51031 RepID=A0ABR1D5W7_NECAM
MGVAPPTRGPLCTHDRWIEPVPVPTKPFIRSGVDKQIGGHGSRTPSMSLTKIENILDDNGEGTKRVEEMLGLPRPVKTGHLSI